MAKKNSLRRDNLKSKLLATLLIVGFLSVSMPGALFAAEENESSSRSELIMPSADAETAANAAADPYANRPLAISAEFGETSQGTIADPSPDQPGLWRRVGRGSQGIALSLRGYSRSG